MHHAPLVAPQELDVRSHAHLTDVVGDVRVEEGVLRNGRVDVHEGLQEQRVWAGRCVDGCIGMHRKV